MMTDQLVEIERKHWQTLRDLYSHTNPETYSGFCLLDNYIRWSAREPKSVDVLFYSLNGDWSDGTFLAIWKSQDDGDIVSVNSLGNSRERVMRLLGLIDFSKGLCFEPLAENRSEAIQEVINLKNVKLQCKSGTWYHLPRSNALSIEITPPEGITLKPISQSDVHIIEHAYPKPFSNSLQTFQTMARLNPNIGAYKSDGRLIAWALRWPLGDIGALQVDEEYQRRGLGTLVIEAISRKIAEMGHDVCAGVTDGNAASQAIFEKLGFSSVFKACWIDTLSTETNGN